MKGTREHTGNVLLVTILLIGVLSALAIGLSELVIGDLRLSRLTFESAQARYAAEAAVERALLKLKTQPMGFEERKEGSFDNGALYRYDIAQRAARIPEKEFLPLRLNESATVPLFRGEGADNNARSLKIEYYLEPQLREGTGLLPEGIDVLRFKLFGITAAGKTESLNEYYPAALLGGAGACIGTSNSCWNHGVYYGRMAAPDGGEIVTVEKIHPIAKFLQEHEQNVLVLTNVINTDVIAGTYNPDRAIIWYRVIEETGEDRLLTPRIRIAADGQFGQSRESIDVEVDRSKLLPVFHFALYRTKTD